MNYWLIIFILSAAVLFWSGSKLVKSLIRIARFLGWREFIVAFFIMAVAGSLPNLFVGVDSALHGIPQLSFGDIVGGNITDLTFAVALTIIIGGRALPVRVKMVQQSIIITVFTAILPLILILDGVLGKVDSFVFILIFISYILWLFSKNERFRKKYNHYYSQKRSRLTFIKRIKSFFKNIVLIFFYLALILLASEGIVRSAKAFSSAFNISLPMIGILIIGIGNALPETYFAIASARKKQTAMILGDLIGSVIVCSTLVLGIVAFIHPIEITDIAPFAVGRSFLMISALFFWFFAKTGRRFSKKEALLMLLVFISFIFVETYLK